MQKLNWGLKYNRRQCTATTDHIIVDPNANRPELSQSNLSLSLPPPSLFGLWYILNTQQGKNTYFDPVSVGP